LRQQRRLAFGDGAQPLCVAVCGAGQIRVVAGDAVIGQLAQLLALVAGGEVFEGADAEMAGGDARQLRAGQGLVAIHGFASGDHRQGARGRDAQRMHGLADQHFAQHRADGGFAVTIARKRRAPRTLEGEVATVAVSVDDFADQQRAAVAQLRREVAELVAGISLGDRRRPLG
jgi:hypothetical protein